MTVDLAAKIAAQAEASRRRRGPQCRVCALPAEWLEGVHGARDKHGTEFSGISRSLKEEGFQVNETSLQHHFQHHR